MLRLLGLALVLVIAALGLRACGRADVVSHSAAGRDVGARADPERPSVLLALPEAERREPARAAPAEAAASEPEPPAGPAPRSAGGGVEEAPIRGRLLLPDGLPIDGVPVWLACRERRFDGESLSTTQRMRALNLERRDQLSFTDADGRFAFEQQLPGVYTLAYREFDDDPEPEALGTALGGEPARLVPGGPELDLVLARRSVRFRLFPLNDDWSKDPRLRLLGARAAGLPDGVGVIAPPQPKQALVATREPREEGREPGLTPGVLLAPEILGLTVQLTDAAGRGLAQDVGWSPTEFRPVVDVVQSRGTARLVVQLSSAAGPVREPDVQVFRLDDPARRDVASMRIAETPRGLELWVPPGPLLVRASASGHSLPSPGSPELRFDLGQYPVEERRVQAVHGATTVVEFELVRGGWVVLGEELGYPRELVFSEAFRWPELRPAGGALEEGVQFNGFANGPPAADAGLQFFTGALRPGAYEVTRPDGSRVRVEVRAGEVATVRSEFGGAGDAR